MAVGCANSGSWESAQKETASSAKDGSHPSKAKDLSDSTSPFLAVANKSTSQYAHTDCGTSPELLVTPELSELPGRDKQEVMAVIRERPTAAVTVPGLPPLPLLPLPPFPSHPLLPAGHGCTQASITSVSKPSSSMAVSTIANSAQQTGPAQHQNLKQKSVSKQPKLISGLSREERIALYMEECSNSRPSTTIPSSTAHQRTQLLCANGNRGREMKTPLKGLRLVEDVHKSCGRRKGSMPDANRSLPDATEPSQELCTATSIVSCSSSSNLPSRPELAQLPVSITPYPLLPLPAGPSTQSGPPLISQPPESIVSAQVAVFTYLFW